MSEQESRNAPPDITAEMLPMSLRSMFYQTDEVLRRVSPDLRIVFRFGLVGHVHGPEFDDPKFEGIDRDDDRQHQAEVATIDAQREAETDMDGLEAYMNFWITSSTVMYRYFGGRPDTFHRAEQLADEILGDLKL